MGKAQTQSPIPRAEVTFARLAGVESCEPSSLYIGFIMTSKSESNNVIFT